jgi:hypothetical protein
MIALQPRAGPGDILRAFMGPRLHHDVGAGRRLSARRRPCPQGAAPVRQAAGRGVCVPRSNALLIVVFT